MIRPRCATSRAPSRTTRRARARRSGLDGFVDEADGGVDDGRRRRPVGVAHAQVDDVHAPRAGRGLAAVHQQQLAGSGGDAAVIHVHHVVGFFKNGTDRFGHTAAALRVWPVNLGHDGGQHGRAGRHLDHFHVRAQALADGLKAAGVTDDVGYITRQKGIIHLLHALAHLPAGTQIVLCAGALQSPQLLLLSGIGDAAELAHRQWAKARGIIVERVSARRIDFWYADDSSMVGSAESVAGLWDDLNEFLR